MRPAALILPLLAVAACSSPPDPGPRFDDEAQQAELTCIQHQPAAPGPRYTDAAQRDTAESLALLRYYTANSRKPYCDNQGPTDTDRSWARIYVDLGGNQEIVAHLLPEGGS